MWSNALFRENWEFDVCNENIAVKLKKNYQFDIWALATMNSTVRDHRNELQAESHDLSQAE